MSNPKKIFTPLGASNHSLTDREDNDFYATDPRALELLLELEDFDPFVWECACGKGHLSEVLKKHGHIVKSTDLIDRGYGVGGVDFLATTTPFNGDIITNPPYKYAQEFVEHALSLIPEGNRVAMFLKLTFLESKNRRAMFELTPPPLHICVIEPTAMCHRWRFRDIQKGCNVSRSLRLVYMGKGVHGRTHRQVV